VILKTAPSPQAVVDELLKTRLTAFAQRCFQYLEPGKRFVMAPHIAAISHALENVLDGKTRRLIISLPPRMLKSHMASIALPAYALLKNGGTRLITASHTADLASSFLVKSRLILDSPWYQALAPRTRLARRAQNELITTRGGGRYAIGVEGALLGRGGDIIIIDDAMASDAMISEADRRRVWDWYTGVVGSRLDNPKEGAIIVVAQRLHIDDLTGKLLEMGGWEHLCLPAIAWEDQAIPIGEGKVWRRRAGDLLHEERLGREELETIKRIQDFRFEAQYQQRPVPSGGYLFRMKEFRYYDPKRMPPRQVEAFFISVDSALSISPTADYTAISVWGIRGPEIFLRTCIRGRWGFPEQMDQIEKLIKRYQADKTLIEGAASGPMLVEELRRRGHAVLSLYAKTDKIARAEATRLALRQGLVHLPRNAPECDWLVNELALFPHGRNDDGVDTFTLLMMALDRMHSDVPRLSYYRHPVHDRPDAGKREDEPWIVD
jgi:predicted phage terminase large subunit-like protein